MSLPSYKEIVELVKKGATLEAQEKIMELREASINLQEENYSLRDQIRDLKEKLETKDSLVFEGEVYFKVDDDKKDGPYCPGCYDSNSKLIRMHPFNSQGSGSEWQCKICDTFYSRHA